MNTIPQKDVDGSPQLDERLWQAWLLKGRELKRVSAAKRIRIIQYALLSGLVIAGFQYMLR